MVTFKIWLPIIGDGKTLETCFKPNFFEVEINSFTLVEQTESSMLLNITATEKNMDLLRSKPGVEFVEEA